MTDEVEAGARPMAPEPLVAGTRVERTARAADADTDPVVLADLACDPSWRVRAECAANMSTPPASIDQLVADPNSRVRIRVAGRPGLSPEQLWVLAGDDNAIVRQRVLWTPNLDVATLAELIDHPDFEPDPHLSQRLLPLVAVNPDRLARHPSVALRRLAARSPRLADSSVARLTTDPDLIIRLLMAISARTPAGLVAVLATDSEPGVRAAVAERIDLTRATARRLATDDLPQVAAVLAANPAAPGRLLARQAIRRSGVAVHRSTAGNRGAPSLVLWLIRLTSLRWDIRAALGSNPAASRLLLWSLGVDRRVAVQVAVASNPSTPRLRLRAMSHIRRPMVRFALAGNRRCPVKILDRLARLDPLIAQQVAMNPSTPGDLLRGLTGGMEAPAWILRTVATNPNCPPDLASESLTWLAIGGAVGNADFDGETCVVAPHDQLSTAEWYRRNATLQGRTSPLWRVRSTIVSANKKVPISLAVALGRDPHPAVRRSAVALRPLPVKLTHELLSDADPVVASGAHRVLNQGKTIKWTVAKYRVGRLLFRRNVRLAVVLIMITIAAFVFNSPHHDYGSTGPSLGDSTIPQFSTPDSAVGGRAAFAMDQATGLELSSVFDHPAGLIFIARSAQHETWHVTYVTSHGFGRTSIGPMNAGAVATVPVDGAQPGYPVVLQRGNHSTTFSLPSLFGTATNVPSTPTTGAS